ncbi:hypothetical protein C2S51_036319 [Perilla frutescens var. frutescens]|nr:hypothetical protein C2S51_036319 [Perilla frutescens var. frutescens]
MENFNILLVLATAAALTIISKIVLFQSRQRHRNLPPGPKPWPIIGNLHLIGPSPHKSLHSLSQKYGEIMLLKFGKNPVVIASSPEMAKQFFKVHDANFASRPALAAGKYTAYNYSDMLWAPAGPYWRQARKIYLSEVFSAKRLEFYEPLRAEERLNFLSCLWSQSRKPVELRDHLSRYTLSSVTRMVLNNKYFAETEQENSAFKFEELQHMVEEWISLNGVINIGDWIPWINFLDVQGYVGRMKKLFKKLDKFLDYVIDDHQARRVAEKDNFVEKDVVDTLLQLAEDPNLEVKLTRDCIKALIQDLLVGGTDTSSGTVEWAIHGLMRYPHVIEKAKEELDRVIGRNRWAEEDDFSQLPYINAIMMETMRLHPVTPLVPPHYAIDDCKVAGYHISKGTTVIINIFSLGRDPNTWDSPEEFLPERFMGKDVDITGSNFALLPFSSGRRICVGHKLAIKVVGTTLANLLHGFDLKLVEGMMPQDICMDEVYGIAVHPKHPFPIIMEPTLPPHLYSM